MMKPVVFSDHPDHGWKWTDLELRWIAERDKQWKERVAQLERELAECKADAKDWKNRYEGMAILHSNKVRMIENGDLVRHVNVLKIEKERDALAAQVVQMREALEWADGWIPAKATDEYRQGEDGCICPMCKALEMSGEYPLPHQR